jgi:hypothetical protein
MNNFCISTDLCLLQKNCVNIAGTLQLNRKNAHLVVKAKLKQGDLTTMQRQGITVMNSFHSDTTVAVFKKGRDLHKPGSIQEYNLFTGRVDFKVKGRNMKKHKVVHKISQEADKYSGT